MKKALLSLAVAGLAWSPARAQPVVGAVAPDFTLTDINGVSQHLYEYTNQGYTVIIDLSAAWCGPCWDVHQSHVLKDLYNQYGPTGTITPGKIMVLFIEGESANTTAQLHGTGVTPPNNVATGTQGDWVSGEPYPIIDNSSQNDNYMDAGFPTFTVICPNRRIAFVAAGYSTAMLQTSFWTPFINQCPSAVSGTNASTVEVGTLGYTCKGSGQSVLKAEIQNMGTAPLTAATVVAKVNGSAIATQNWTGNLAKYESAVVNIGNYTFTQSSTDVTYEVTVANDALATDNSKVKTTTALTSSYKSWQLLVKTDNFPGETSWKVKNSSGTVVQQHSYTAGSGAGGPDAMKLFTHDLNLNANECYTIEVADDYGDGMLEGAPTAADTGYIQLKDASGLIYNFGRNFGKGATMIVKSGQQGGGVGIEEVIAQGELKAYPNPVIDQLNVEMNMVKSAKVSFTFVNLLGQQIGTSIDQTLNNGHNKVTLNTATLAPGVYVLNITTDKGSIRQKFVKK